MTNDLGIDCPDQRRQKGDTQAILDDASDTSDFEARTLTPETSVSPRVTEAAEPLGRGQEEGAGLDRDAGDRSAIEGEGAG